jgi:GMP synthase (glutamine-hydrolysing)
MDTLAVLDFGGQYTHLIANRIRRLAVYSEIVPCDIAPEDARGFKGLILSGGPHSVMDEASPTVDPRIFDLGLPVLGLCYGHQLMAKALGGSVLRSDLREYGIAQMSIQGQSPLLKNLDSPQQIWMSHGDAVDGLAPGFEILGSTSDCPTAAVGDAARRFYGLQFHPEVTDTPCGMDILSNFIDICGCRRSWSPRAYVDQITDNLRRECGDRKVFLLVSGGVDSTVAFALCNQALGPDRVLGFHIDNGLMRHWESSDIERYMKEHGFDNLHFVDASDAFLRALDGVCDPEQKRDIIGRTFLDVKQKGERDLGLNADEWLLGQGTIYPDTIESAGSTHADKIKTHHNRVDVVLELIAKGLVVEPLAQLYKDEVRQVGEALGIPHKLVWRHPFPGPGLGVRCLCSNGEEAPAEAEALEQVSRICASTPYQCEMLPVRSVGVQGDGRTYAHPALVRGPRDWRELENLSTRITNAVRGVNRVVYALSSRAKPCCRLHKALLTTTRLDRLRAVDNLVTETLYASGEYETIWQMPVVLLPVVNGNGEECVVLRPIVSQEAMTARFCPLHDNTLETIVAGAAEIDGIGDIFFDITHKPPGTIEWE